MLLRVVAVITVSSTVFVGVPAGTLMRTMMSSVSPLGPTFTCVIGVTPSAAKNDTGQPCDDV